MKFDISPFLELERGHCKVQKTLKALKLDKYIFE